MKKILSLALALLMVVSAVPMVYAADVDYTAGTAVEYTADSDANRAYTITVPASLDPGASGTVTLSGSWASNETVKVTADANVVLTNSINAADTKTLDVTFAGIEKAGDNTEEKTYTETVSVAAMPEDALFGTWSGKFNYNVEFDDGKVQHRMTPAAYGVRYVDNRPDYPDMAVIFTEDGKYDVMNGESRTLTMTLNEDVGYFSEDGYTFYMYTWGTKDVEYTYTYTP